ncbi:MAG: glycosyltransferase [Verrucomicrobiae bacterium]|nr:glycosyltransferase [Verrucomicrobiae bacterium]
MTPASQPSYVVITPARNEEANLERLIGCLAAQSIRPSRWVVVDDGSTDRTPAILEAATRTHPWIQSVRRQDRGHRKPGAGVVEAFYDGYGLVEDFPRDFIVKLDGDLSFDPDHFAACFAEFDKEPRLGIAGGAVWTLQDGTLLNDGAGDPPFHVRGATKIYRQACWHDIGGLIRMTGWDTFDEIKANSLGWTTRTLAHLRVIQHRQTGGADGSWRNWFKNGRANYVVGYHPVFMFAKCCRRIFQRPFVLAAAALWSGYTTGYLTSAPRVGDLPAIRFLRNQQFRALLGRPSFWSR